jgi:hypothetical protein
MNRIAHTHSLSLSLTIQRKLDTMTTFREYVKRDWTHFQVSSSQSTMDTVFKGLGILGWTITYIGIILAHTSMTHSLIWGPVIAYNLVWEALKSTVWSGEDSRWLTALFGIGWFTLDLLIAHKFWQDGDGSDRSLDEQRTQFVAWIGLYLGIAYTIYHTKSASLSRIWRHCSFTWGNLIQYGFICYHEEEAYPYAALIMVSSAVGNLFYIWSVRDAYRGWMYVHRHPIQCLLFTTQFLPAIAMSLMCIIYPWYSM